MKVKNLAYKTSAKIIESRAKAFFIDFLILLISLSIISSFIEDIWLYSPLVISIYYTLTESIFGFTFGKYFLNLRVVDINCNKPVFYKVLLRSLFYLIDFNPITFVLTYIIVKRSMFKQRIGDKVSGIFVVYKRDLDEYLNNEFENSMEFDDFVKYYRDPSVELVKNNAGSYIITSNAQYINIANDKKKIIGINNMTYEQLVNEVNRGARFKYFYTCVSVLIVTNRNISDIYFIPAGESEFNYHFKHSLITLLFGWWGIPWGIIWTISSLANNLNGGEDITQEVLDTINAELNWVEKRQSNSFHEVGNVTLGELQVKFKDMSDYEFKTKYLYNISKFSGEIYQLIKNEDEYRRSKNHNYENYNPQYIQNADFRERPVLNYDTSHNKKKKPYAVILTLIFILFIVFIAIYPSTDYEKLANAEYDSGNYLKAIEYTDMYLKDNPHDVNAILFKIDALYMLGKYEEAISLCNELETISPKNEDNYYYLGLCNYSLAKFNESIKWFDKCINIDQESSNPYEWKASAYYELEEYDEAINTVDSLLAFDSYNVSGLKIKGESLMALGKYDESVKIFDRALVADPDNIELEIDKMEALFRQKKYAQLMETCEIVHKMHPDNENAMWYMGDCYSIKEDHENAIQCYEKALEINPKNDNIIASIAFEYYNMQDYEKTSEYTEKALDLNADNSTAIALKKELEEAKKPESVRIANFVRDNYLYLDKIKNADNIINSFAKKENVSIKDINKFIDSIRYKDDIFTYVISDEEYDYLEDYKDSNHIDVKSINDNTKYIKIYMFTQGTAYEFKDALDNIKNPEKQNLIIDLRDNPGGLAYPTNNILDALLPEYVTSYVIYRDGYINTYNSDSSQIKFKHIYIFVNENSASSSELLSLGLKNYLNNVTIIGTPTVGKGVGQITFEEKKKKYVIYLVNHYWNVKEKNIMGSNIKPDILVKGKTDADYFSKVK
ncbi:MAG TPA: S41 family peptidase [Pseudobacteroides sp.]|nr:S41 family peptidase [Pseudobacteroides sp.]